MAVTASDLKFFASAVMTDNVDGGGSRSSTIVQNGVLNNIFPSISAADRATGRVNLRKVWPSITNADSAALLGAAVSFNEIPSDPAVNVAVFKYGDSTTTRAQALAALKGGGNGSLGATYAASGTATSGSAVATGFTFFPGSSSFDSSAAEKWAVVAKGTGATLNGALTGEAVIRRVVSRGGGSGNDITFDATLPWSGTVTIHFIHVFPNSATAGGPRVYGADVTSANAVATDASISLAKTFVNVAGAATGALLQPTVEGWGSLRSDPKYAPSLGRVPFVEAGDRATLHHEAATSAATATNGGTVNVGRTNVDQFAVVGNDGVEILRLLKDGPTDTRASANFATGVLTFNNVTGFSQPVTVRHRIVHNSAISSVTLNVLGLATPLTRDFPSGSVLSTLASMGDTTATVGNVISQQAWTRVWSDTLIGNSVPTMYSSTITITNQGAETDRFAIVFTSGNTFDCYSERLGKIASGNTTTNFAPINPSTGAPFFTLASANWASGLLVGSVLRFNTIGACAPTWPLRSVEPSTASGTVRAVLRLSGSID